MISQLKYTLKYLKYLFFAKHKKGHGIHSPFMFDLVTKVFNNNIVGNDLQKVLKIHNRLKNSKEILEYNEIGAGSAYKNKKKQTLGQIISSSSINKKYGKLLFNIVRYLEPENILELGTSVGISTAYIAQASRNSNLKSIEGVKVKTKIAQDTAQKLNLNTEFITGNFNDIIDDIVKKYKKLDFVFFDGNHKKQSTLKYFNTCLEKIHNDSIFIFDDIHWSDEMEEAWNEIINNKSVRVSVDLFRMGLIFFKQELSYEQYVIKF